MKSASFFPFGWFSAFLVLFSVQVMAISNISISNGTPSAAIVKELTDRGFSCHPSGAGKNVQRCLGRIDDYPESVLFFVPDVLTDTKIFNLVYHFHGYNIYPGQGPLETHFNETDGSGDFASWIDKGHLNGVVVAPLSRGHCTTFFEYFSGHQATRAFFEETQKIIFASSNVNFQNVKLSLSSHSGSDKTLSYIADTLPSEQFEKLHAMGFFDSMYGHHEGLVDTISEHHLKVFDSFLVNGTTARYQNWFIENLRDSHIDPTVVRVSNATHMTLMSKDQFSNFLSMLP
jgi:hypothetical protein